MKVTTKYYEDTEYEGRECYIIDIDGKQLCNAGRGEPEDNSLGRDLNFVFGIEPALKAAFEAGKNGESYEHIYFKGTLADLD